MRNKEATKKKLLDALGAIICEHGFTEAGVNSVARRAGVDKVLIYRYFGGFDGLMGAYAAQFDFLAEIEQRLQTHTVSSREEGLKLGEEIILGQFKALNEHPELREMYRWELLTRNEATDALATAREMVGIKILRVLQRFFPADKDFPAIASLIIGGVYYLVLRSGTVQQNLGIRIDTEEGRERISNAIKHILKAMEIYAFPDEVTQETT